MKLLKQQFGFENVCLSKMIGLTPNQVGITEEIHLSATGRVQNVTTKRLFTIKELTTEIGGTEWFWRSQIWDGQLPYVQVGRKMFVDREDIEAFIQRNKNRN